MADPVSRSTTIDSPVETVLDVILDFDSYPDWQKEVTSTQVHERDEQGRPAKVTICTEAMGLQGVTTVAITYLPDGLKWSLVEGNTVSRNDTEYHLRPSEGGGTDFDFSMAMDLTVNLPPILVKQVLKKGAHDTVEGIKQVAEARTAGAR